MEPSLNVLTYMGASLYKAAAEGKIEEFNNYEGSELESLKTPNHNNVLHVNLASTHHKIVSRFFRSSCQQARSRSSDFIEQMLNKCPSLLMQTNAQGQTPLYIAARHGHSDGVKLLIAFQAKAGDDHGGQLEQQATALEAVRRMLRKSDLESNTALHVATEYGNVGVVRELLEFEVPSFSYSVNKNQETPLYIAVKRRNLPLLTMILDKFKSAAHSGPHGRTALHAAVMTRDAEILKLLKEIENEEMAEKAAGPFQIVSKDRLEKATESHLVVATLIATVTFAAAVTVPGGYKSEKGPDQGTPFLIHDAAFIAFVISDIWAFFSSIGAIYLQFKKFVYGEDHLLGFGAAADFIVFALWALVIAFITGTYAILKPSPRLAIPILCVTLYFFLPLFSLTVPALVQDLYVSLF